MMQEWLESVMFWNKSMFSIKTKMTGSSYLHIQKINITFKCVRVYITAMNVLSHLG